MKIPENLLVVMPGHSRPKDGVFSHTYAPGIHVLGRIAACPPPLPDLRSSA